MVAFMEVSLSEFRRGFTFRSAENLEQGRPRFRSIAVAEGMRACYDIDVNAPNNARGR